MKAIRGDLSGRGLKIGVVASRFNPAVTDRLLEGALSTLFSLGVSKRSVTVVTVPGAIEIAGAAQALIKAKRPAAVVALGAVIKGETSHFTYVCKAVQEGLTRLTLDAQVPITFGVLTTSDRAQAMARSGGAKGNKGAEAARDAVELANTYKALKR